MRLSIADIATLDFGKLVWVDGALWRLHKIVDYNMSEADLCEVQLLKVIEITY
jgi:acetoacetate decarboxylase